MTYDSVRNDSVSFRNDTESFRIIRNDSVGYDGHCTLQEKNRKDFKFPIVEPLKNAAQDF